MNSNKSPNRKYRLVKASTTGEDERVNLIISSPNSDLAKLFAQGEEIYNNKLKKGYVEACLFASENLEEISRILEVSIPVLEVYLEFFFDVKGWDRLSKLEHIDSIPDSRKQEMMLKMWALNHGLDFIAWRIGKTVNISPVEGLQDLFNICLYKSKEAMYSSSTSETSKESTKWVKLSTDISRLLKLWVMDSTAAKRDLEIAIKEVVPEFGGIDFVLKENDEISNVSGIDDILNEGQDEDGLNP
jgi:hypothetical protein